MPYGLTIDDDITKKLLELERVAPGTIDNVATRITMAFKDHTRDKYMSGQIIGERTGKAKRAIWDRYVRKGTFAFKVPRLANIFETGAVVKPDKAMALHFINKAGQDVFIRGSVKLEKRPFWSMSWRDYISSSYAGRIAQEVIEKEWTRRFN